MLKNYTHKREMYFMNFRLIIIHKILLTTNRFQVCIMNHNNESKKRTQYQSYQYDFVGALSIQPHIRTE